MLDFKEELQKMTDPDLDTQFTDCENEVNTVFETLNSTVTKLFKKQGAMEIQVEEMYAILEEQENEKEDNHLEEENNKLRDTLIAAADMIEDFYLFYKEHYDETLTPQSTLMWNALCKKMAGSGFIRIADEETPFHAELNTMEGVANNPSLPQGYILKVLKSGYRYQEKVLRKSIVIVNKPEDK